MNSMVAGWCWVASGGLLLAGPVPAEEPVGLLEFVISLKDDSPAAKVVRDHLAETLAPVLPQTEGKPQVSETKGGGSILWGDLFKTGSCYALYEPKVKGEKESATLALAEWKEGKWELRGLWKMPLHWMPAEADEGRWSGPDGYCDPRNKVHVPFELADVMADDVAELIVSGEKTKYHQAMYVMKFDKESRGLELLTYSMARPVKAGGYLRVYDASGNKAIWQEWTFLEWKEGKLAERAAWHSECPYNNIDPAFNEARVMGADGTLEEFRATMGNGEEGNAWSYVVEKDGKPFAKLRVNWLPEKSRENEDLMEGAWLFEKLTGLAREDFPERHGPETAEKKKLGRLEDSATVEVEPAAGNEAARARFSGGK